MLARLGLSFMNSMRKVLPNEFVIAVIITFVVVIAGIAAGNSIIDMGDLLG